MTLTATANYHRPLIFSITGLQYFSGVIVDLIQESSLSSFKSLTHLLTHPSQRGFFVDPNNVLWIRYGNKYQNSCGVKLQLHPINDL